jgi:D-glycero-alpha-D-manno-heptose-7-phosphate kinase
MREEWTARRKNAPGITTPLIDRLVTVARRAGSMGAKVCGAGGGGCVVFLTAPDAKEKVASAVASAGAAVLDAKVARHGVQIRVAR